MDLVQAPSFRSLHLRFVVNGLFVRVCLIFREFCVSGSDLLGVGQLDLNTVQYCCERERVKWGTRKKKFNLSLGGLVGVYCSLRIFGIVKR